MARLFDIDAGNHTQFSQPKCGGASSRLSFFRNEGPKPSLERFPITLNREAL